MIDLWYKNSVIYCLDVRTFMDGNGDGMGDFRGLTDRLDHIEALGATCVWLLPFYPSPNRDNGYDITDYYGVDPRLGTLGEFTEFAHAAKDRGLRIILDLVINHTSIDHPWFQSARSDPKSPYRDWYIWSENEPADSHDGVVFPGVQDATWTRDEEAGAWYHHRFYKHQPDLNIANPAVREEIERIMGFWLQIGAHGFRIDAVPFIIEDSVARQRGGEDPHRYLSELRSFTSWRRAEATLLAEANIKMDEADEYFGDGDRLHVIFNFVLNQHLFLSLARGEAQPVAQMLRELPAIPDKAQWATFLRNHDELDLGRLADAEREETFRAFAPDEGMRLYNRGIRRRLAPMLGGDARRIAMAESLMLALPGTAMIWYGEEIGMGDDLSQPERLSVRTPMQWDDSRNAGFSTASADRLVRPVVADGPFGYRRVNIGAQRDIPDSLLTVMQRLVRVRRACREVGWGTCHVLDHGGAPGVLALRHDWRGNTTVTLHNLSDEPAELRLALDDLEGRRLVTLNGDEPDRGALSPDRRLRLRGYGFRWIRSDAPGR